MVDPTRFGLCRLGGGAGTAHVQGRADSLPHDQGTRSGRYGSVVPLRKYRQSHPDDGDGAPERRERLGSYSRDEQRLRGTRERL